MTAEEGVVDKISLLSTPLHLLLDKGLIDLFEFASKTLWENRHCHSTKASVNYTDVFRSTNDFTHISADTFLIVLTRTKVELSSHLKVQRRAKKGINIGTFKDLSLHSKVSQFSPAPVVHNPVERWLEDCWEKKNFFPAVDREHAFTSAPAFEPLLSFFANGNASAESEKLIISEK